MLSLCMTCAKSISNKLGLGNLKNRKEIRGGRLQGGRMNADQWKSIQRDWLLEQLRSLVAKWTTEAAAGETVFSPDPDVDNVAKGRTGGCARELSAVLKGIE